MTVSGVDHGYRAARVTLDLARFHRLEQHALALNQARAQS